MAPPWVRGGIQMVDTWHSTIAWAWTVTWWHEKTNIPAAEAKCRWIGFRRPECCWVWPVSSSQELITELSTHVREGQRREKQRWEGQWLSWKVRVWLGMWATSIPRLCCVSLSRWSEMVLTQCDSRAVLWMAKWWEIQNKRGQTTRETILSWW